MRIWGAAPACTWSSRKVCCYGYWRVPSPDPVSPPHFTLGKPSLREGVGPVPVTQRSETAGASRGWVPWGWLHCALPSRKPLCSAAWAAGEEERVWLRDWQALGAEPGPALRKTTCWGLLGQGKWGGGTSVETYCLERENRLTQGWCREAASGPCTPTHSCWGRGRPVGGSRTAWHSWHLGGICADCLLISSDLQGFGWAMRWEGGGKGSTLGWASVGLPSQGA